MKKVYLLVSGLLLTVGAANAQVTTASSKAELRTAPSENERRFNAVGADREADAVIWENGFEDAGEWTAEGPSGDYLVSGWSIGASTTGWYFGEDDDMGTSGNFARFVNGDPTGGGDDPIENGPFTLTYNMSIDLTDIPAPHVEFEQYGARFITLQGVEVSTDGGTTWVLAGDNNDIDPLTAGGGAIYAQPESRRFNLTTAIADDPSDVMIRLMWDGAMNGADMNYVEYGWFVDNIRIVEGHSFDAEIQTGYFRANVGGSATYGLDYYQIPAAQAANLNYEFSGELINQGGSALTGLHLQAVVERDGGTVFTGTSDNVTVAPGATDSLSTTASFNPMDEGVYSVVWSFEGDDEDTYTENDELMDQFEVNDANLFARHNGVATGSISNVTSNTAAPLLIGNIMDIFADGTEIGAVDITITDAETNEDQLIFAQINVLNADGSAFEYYDQTGDHTITADEVGGTIRLFFEDPVVLDEGQTMLIMAGHYGGSDEVEFSYAQAVDDFTVYGYTSGATDPFRLLEPNAIMITAVTQSFVGIEDEVANNFAIGQNMPNPFNNTSVINYELNEAANVSVEIVDVTGKLVKSINQGTQAAGAYTLNLDANDFAEGVYYYTFVVGAEKVTKSMVITK